MSDADALARHRGEIDSIDDQIVDLLARRRAVAALCGTAKPVGDRHLRLRPDREAAVIARVRARAGAAADVAERLWRGIMAAGLAEQQAVTVAAWPSLPAAVVERFGGCPVRICASAEDALSLAAKGPVVAVIGLDHNGGWQALRSQPDLLIFDVLEEGPSALVGRVDPETLASGPWVVVGPEQAGDTVLAAAGQTTLALRRKTGERPDGAVGRVPER